MVLVKLFQALVNDFQRGVGYPLPFPLPLAGVALLLPEGVVHFIASHGYNNRHIVIDSTLHGGQQNPVKASANVS